MSESKLIQKLKRYNNSVKIIRSNKFFYGKFTHRLDYFIPGVFTLYQYNAKINLIEIGNILQTRVENEFMWANRSKNIAPDYVIWSKEMYDLANKRNYRPAPELFRIYKTFIEFDSPKKYRVENNFIYFYFTSEDDALRFFNKLQKNKQDVFRYSAAKKEILSDGKFPLRISTKYKKYSYQVYLRHEKWNQTEAANFLNYTATTKSQLPPKTRSLLRDRITTPNQWPIYHHLYFYVKDEKSLLFLKLMFNTKIGKVYQLISGK